MARSKVNKRDAKRLALGAAADILRGTVGAGWPDDARLESFGLGSDDEDVQAATQAAMAGAVLEVAGELEWRSTRERVRRL